MTTFYKFKMAWGEGKGGGAADRSDENTTDNCWLNVCQDMGGRECVLDNLNVFGLNKTYFDSNFYMSDF